MPRPRRPACVRRAAQPCSPQATLQAVQQELYRTNMGSRLDVSRQQDCGLDTIALVSGRQLGGRLVLHVAWQQPALSLQAMQEQDSGANSLPCGQPEVFQLLGVWSAALQGNCGTSSPCRRLSVEGLTATAAGGWLLADSPGVLSPCLVKAGSGGRGLLQPRPALCGQCLAASCNRSSSGGGQLQVLLHAVVQPNPGWSRVTALPLVLPQQLHVCRDCPRSHAQAENCRPSHTWVPAAMSFATTC